MKMMTNKMSMLQILVITGSKYSPFMEYSFPIGVPPEQARVNLTILEELPLILLAISLLQTLEIIEYKNLTKMVT